MRNFVVTMQLVSDPKQVLAATKPVELKFLVHPEQ
jgi:hypothetical protein